MGGFPLLLFGDAFVADVDFALFAFVGEHVQGGFAVTEVAVTGLHIFRRRGDGQMRISIHLGVHAPMMEFADVGIAAGVADFAGLASGEKCHRQQGGEENGSHRVTLNRFLENVPQIFEEGRCCKYETANIEHSTPSGQVGEKSESPDVVSYHFVGLHGSLPDSRRIGVRRSKGGQVNFLVGGGVKNEVGMTADFG
jgi:hypothetical protein